MHRSYLDFGWRVRRKGQPDYQAHDRRWSPASLDRNIACSVDGVDRVDPVQNYAADAIKALASAITWWAIRARTRPR